MVIWKYRLKVTGTQGVMMPDEATPLCVQVQNGEPTLWALVDPKNPNVCKGIRMSGTGETRVPSDWQYIGTVQIDGYVWHYFW